MIRRKCQQSQSPDRSRQPGLRWLGLLTLLLSASLPINLAAQPTDDTDDSQDNGQHVEESEQAFRRRMELEEAATGTEAIPDRTAQGAKPAEGIEALPFESRKHLRDEMRNVIIEQGEWNPEYANNTYPYNPSAAAQGDPELRQKEEKAWGELVQEYHKREAAAMAGGGRTGGSQGSLSGRQSGEQSGAQTGAQSGAESGSPGSTSSASQASRKASPSSPDKPPEADASSSAAGAGVSQSALEFLKAQSGGQAGGQSGGKSGSQTSVQAGSQAAAGSSGEAGQTSPMAIASASPSPAQQQQAKAEQQSDSSSKANEKSTESEPPPPGSVAIAELQALEKAEQAKAAEAGQDKGSPAEETKPTTPSNTIVLKSSADTDSQPPRPGTIAIPELEKLKGVEQESAPEDPEF